MNVAAIYGRKSDDSPASVKDQQKDAVTFISEYPALAGWTVGEAYLDNAISGGTFDRPELNRLLQDLTQRPVPFQALVMMDGSRLGRDMGETLALQQRITKLGVRVFHYQDKTELFVNTPVQKLQASIANFGHEDFRHQIAAKTKQALKRKHADGFVACGRLFGYDNVRLGEKQVVRKPNAAQAAVVKRIFTRYAEGIGMRRIAADLNRDQVPARGKCWYYETLRDMLQNQHYIGVVTYGGVTRTDASLRIIPQGLWNQVQARLANAKDVYCRSHGQLQGKPLNGAASAYLLSGLLQCQCGSVLQARVSNNKYWRCRASYEGKCTTYAVVSMKRVDTAILEAVRELLEPDVLAAYLYPLAKTSPDLAAQRAALETELATVTTQCARLATAIAQGGALDTLLGTLKDHEQRKQQLIAALATLVQAPARPTGDLSAWGKRCEEVMRLGGYTGLAQAHPARARQLLGKLLLGRITLTPKPGGGLTFSADLTVGPLAGQLGFTAVRAGGSRTRTSAPRCSITRIAS